MELVRTAEKLEQNAENYAEEGKVTSGRTCRKGSRRPLSVATY
jgi:hypothetical protein